LNDSVITYLSTTEWTKILEKSQKEIDKDLENINFPHKNEHWRIDGKETDFHGFGKYMADKFHLVRTVDGYFVYDKGQHKKIPDQQAFLLAIVQVLGRKQGPRRREIEELKIFVEMYSKLGESQIEKNTGLMNLQNGIINVKTGELMKHTPDYFFTYQLPYKYDPKSKCERFDWFLNDIFKNKEGKPDSERIKLTWQIFAYCILGGKPFLEKAFMLLGTGANGKSTFITVLQNLVGDHNCSSLDLDALKDIQQIQELRGKMINLSDETPKLVDKSEKFKNIVSGGEIMGKILYKQPIKFRNQARMIFACNDYPQFNDTTHGLFRKISILGFDRALEDVEIDTEIDEQL